MRSRPDFRESVAVVVGIDAYDQGVPPLRTAAADARRLAQLLADAHGYAVHLLLDGEATRDALTRLLTVELPATVGADDRVLFYFAGHGVALDGDDGPSGYLLPHDARRGEPETYLPMPALYDALDALPCRHLLALLDSCFAGAFRWSATRDMVELPAVIHQERYDRFILDPAWQAIASASHDQKALDQRPSGDAFADVFDLGERGDDRGDHSPFAAALFDALGGAGDVVPAGEGDGVITATELYLYLEERLQPATIAAQKRQTPRLWPLAKHDKGEFIFLVPGHELNLPPAPELTTDNNPWLGLKSYDETDEDLFFGREDVIDDLAAYVEGHPLTVVLGASGTGKSSVVKAGLVPRLKRDVTDAWHVLPVVRPGPNLMQALRAAVADLGGEGGLEEKIATWVEAHEALLVLVVDQFEELITLTRSAEEREAALALLARLVETYPDRLRLVLTLRSDFEPQFDRTALETHWQDARLVVPPMTQADLRAVIERPASERVMYFKPAALVDDLIDEVIQTPGGLPLLSFALSEMYVHYVRRYADGETDDRALEVEDYAAVGGVVGALRTRAEAEYGALDTAHRKTMRRVLLRMVAPEGGNVARRRVPRSDLDYPDPAETERAHAVVRRLTAARLLVEGRSEDGEPYVEPAHDALVRAWDRLLGWIHAEQDRAASLRFQQNMARAARDWAQTDDRSAKRGLLWQDEARSRLLESLVDREEQRLPVETQALLKREQSFRERALVAAQQSTQRVRDLWRQARGRPATDYRAWMNRRELAFAQKSIQRRMTVQAGLGLLVLLIIAGGIVAFVQAGIARDNARESQARFLAAEMENALRDGDRPLAFRLAQEAWQTDDNATSRAALRRLAQTVLPLASVEGDKVIVPDNTPLIFTTRAIYDGEGRFVDSVRADHLAFAPSGAYFLAISHDTTRSVREAVYNLHDGATAALLARFDPAPPSPGNRQVLEDQAAGIVALSDADDRTLGRWRGAAPLVSNDGRYVLSIRDIRYVPEFWMTWDLRDADGLLLDSLTGHTPAPSYAEPVYLDAYRDAGFTGAEFTRLGPFRLDEGTATLQNTDARPLLTFPIDTEPGENSARTEWALLNDWQNNLVADFIFHRSEGYTDLKPDLFRQTQAHQSMQFFPPSRTLLIWDVLRGGELWNTDELRRAQWLAGAYHKLSEAESHVVTREGPDLFVWSWDGHLQERHRGRDVFPTPDLRYRLLVGDDGLTTVREAVNGEAGTYEDRFVFGAAESPSISGLPDDFYREQFVRFDPDGRGFVTLTVDSLLSLSTGGDIRYRYMETERLRSWSGEMLRATSREEESVGLPSVPPRPGEETTTRSCAPDAPICAELIEKTIVVWDTLAAGPSRPDDDALRTYDLYERGEQVAFAPSGRFLLGVTASGRAKIWAFDPDFDPEAFLARHDETLRPLTPDERTRYRIDD